MPETESDSLLLARMSRGEDEAFERLFLRHYAQVYRVLYGLVGEREQAEDLVQDTFLELYRNPPRLKDDATLPAWLCRVGLNRGYNALRGERRAREKLIRLPLPQRGEDPYAEAARAEELMTIRKVLAQLPERQVKLLLLRHAGLSYAEVAESIGVSAASVGTLLVRAERVFLTAYRLAESTEGGELRDSPLRSNT
ncbi:MAG TPA: sigma-70 family RNA polymerase sigma factor [Chloroflexia bacterium]|nr:sigma-70 family RNA polymerase sigma factor [Chloroflexia bacterium]